jgi:AraC-like DNA-binding protein
VTGLVEHFSTRTAVPAGRLDYWNRVVRAASRGLAIDSPNPDFAGELKCWHLGEITMLVARAEACVVHRTAVQSDMERVLVHVQTRGVGHQRQFGVAAILKPGDLSVCTKGAPLRLEFSGHEMLVLDLPRAPLEARFPNLGAQLARPVRSSSPATHSFAQYLFALWREAETAIEHLDPLWQASAQAILLDLLALSLRGSQGGSKINRRCMTEAKAMIERRIFDPELCARDIANALGVSVRTVQTWFAAQATTPRAYILERRLERAAERLATCDKASVSAIAFDSGFNDVAYFARCFRRRFGCAPSSWRNGVRNQGPRTSAIARES